MKNSKTYAAMVSVQCIYTGMALLSKVAISKGMDPSVFVVYRQAFASLAVAPFAFFLERNNTSPVSFALLCKIFLTSLCGITLSLNLYYDAINYTSATFSAATMNTIPGITFVMALVLRMETLSLKRLHGVAKLLGSVVSLSGAIVFAFVKGAPLASLHPSAQMQNHQDGSKEESLIRGPLMMLSANTCFSLWLICQGLLLKQYPAKLRLTTLQCVFSCIQSAVWAVSVQRNPEAWKLGWDVHLISVAYCGLLVTGVTYWLQAYAIEEKGPVFASAFTPLTLTITAIASAILWKETLYWGSVGGTILLVFGLYSVLWGKIKEDCEKRNRIHEDRHEQKQDIQLESISSVVQ